MSETNVVTLSTVDQLWSFLEESESRSDSSNFDLRFEGDLAKINMKFQGARYHSSLSSNAMSGLVEFQKSLYRAAAQALYGTDNASRLTQQDKDALVLNYKVEEGCTQIFADLKDFMAKVGEGFKTMDSKHKAITLCVVATLIAGGYVAKTVVDANVVEQQENTKIQLEQERTKQMEILLKKHSSVVSPIFSNIESGIKAVVQGASDAESIAIGHVEFNCEAIAALVERAKRRPTSAELVEGNYKITNINTSSTELLKFTLKADDAINEFLATLDSSAFDVEQKSRLWAAAVDSTNIGLKVNLTKTGDDIKSASIEEILPV